MAAFLFFAFIFSMLVVLKFILYFVGLIVSDNPRIENKNNLWVLMITISYIITYIVKL